MATITTPVFLDGGTARTAGEAMTINSGGSLTVRTDTRVHANAPASNTGSLSSLTINEGAQYVDATAVRWLAYNTGSGNVPSIGTSVTQGGVSGYLLGVWAGVNTLPTAVGAAMPATGFIKFREVTGGPYAAGALTGIGASATGADKAGWLEFVYDDASNMSVPRLGLFQTRGTRFYLDDTTGVRGQVLQIPSMGSAGTRTCGCWIETAPGSGVYDKYPSLNGATNGWANQHIGTGEGNTDKRQQFVKDIGSGQMQIGEATTLAGTYASLAAQAGTYVSLTRAGTYVLDSNVVTVYCAGGHFLEDGQQTGIDFTSGTATDGIYTATVLDPYYFTVPLVAANTSGNCNSREGVQITFTAHGLNIGDNVYCDFTSGTGVDGTYPVYAVSTANIYFVKYPHTAALTSGNVSCTHTLIITTATHNLSVGYIIYGDFTTGSGVDGLYPVKAVTATTLSINFAHSPTTSGNVTLKFDLGYVPPAGCKAWIGNVIGMSCATGTRATNIVPHATQATRPEFSTTAAGAIDLEYLYAPNWFLNLAQPYSVSMKHCAFQDSMILSECATAEYMENCMNSSYSASALSAVASAANFAGGTYLDCKFIRGGAPTPNIHCLAISNNLGTAVTNLLGVQVQYARSSGYSINSTGSGNLTINGTKSINCAIQILNGAGETVVSNSDHTDRLTGRTNGTGGLYAVILNNVPSAKVDGITFGLNDTILNNHPYAGCVSVAGSAGAKVRNLGSSATVLKCGNWAPNLYAMGAAVVGLSANLNSKIQRLYFNNLRTGLFTGLNSDKNTTIESCFAKDPRTTGGARPISQHVPVELNQYTKGISGEVTATGQASIYGTHFVQSFIGVNRNQLALCMNEPTAETAPYFTMVSGVAKFNSSGGILMGVIGNQAVWETIDWVLGYAAFQNITPVMTGGTIGNYTLEYQLNTGSGYGAWTTMTGANLAAETISPTTGFKMKWRITTTTTNTVAITFLRIYLASSWAAMTGATYPLDTVNVTVEANVTLSGAEVRIYDMDNIPAGSLGTELAGTESNVGSTFTFSALPGNSIWIQVMKSGYVEYGQQITVPEISSTTTALLTAELNS
jgi:hypothetical protein